MQPLLGVAAKCGAPAAILSVALAAPALAISNPIIVNIRPVGTAGARGTVSFFQLGSGIIVNVMLHRDRKGTQSVGIHRGTCASYRPRADWVVVGVSGQTQETRVPNLRLSQLLGHVVVIHRTRDRSSAVIGCAAIRNAP